jgi:hypothetical protein
LTIMPGKRRLRPPRASLSEWPRRRPPRSAALALCALGLGCAPLAGCGETLQGHPVGEGTLQALVAVDRIPIYWLGQTFKGMSLTQVSEDYGGAYTMQYGNCAIGGQNTCVSPLQVVTSPEASFKPGSTNRTGTIAMRGRRALLLEGGRTLEIATGRVMVDIYAKTKELALAASATMVPINEPALPGSPLPAPAPGAQSPAEPLPGQLPGGISVVHGTLHQNGAQTTTRTRAHERRDH